MKNKKPFFQSRRIGLCGSQRETSKEFLAFCNAVSREIAQSSDTIIVIAGRKNNDDKISCTADTEFFKGIQKTIHGQDIASRLETFRFKNETRPEQEKVIRHIKTQLKVREK